MKITFTWPFTFWVTCKSADFSFTMDGVETKITISGGMSEYPTHSDNTKDLIELADKAMYKTKQEGGNGIITHINTV